ncbi:MAG: hypothetical protein Q8S24_05790 [Eubacteriales bacterium]|nr:hypothetical protein [Eubacteriales bacterium]
MELIKNRYDDIHHHLYETPSSKLADGYQQFRQGTGHPRSCSGGFFHLTVGKPGSLGLAFCQTLSGFSTNDFNWQGRFRSLAGLAPVNWPGWTGEVTFNSCQFFVR